MNQNHDLVIRKELEINKQRADDALEFSESLINTVREPLISLDQDLRVMAVSRSFYEFFKVRPEETVGQLIYDLGNKQWDIPKLRELLESILPQKSSFDNYEVVHDFATIGTRTMLLNARQIQRVLGKERVILLAIEDITERKQIADDLQKTRRELELVVQLQKTVITDTKESLDLETEGRIFDAGENSHRHDALEAVYAIETALDFTIQSLYDRIVTSICATLHVPSAVIYEYRGGKTIRGSQHTDNQVSRELPHILPCTACRSVLFGNTPLQFSGDIRTRFEGTLCFDPSRFQSYAGVPIRGPQDEIFGMISIMDDTTREFTVSEISFVETLARYIAHEISRRDLESRFNRGEHLRMLGQLTSGVAHEVRNPLNGILAIMGALSKELADDERFKPYLMHMRNQVTRLTSLMEDLLDLGKPLREENMHEMSMVTLAEHAVSTWLQTVNPSKPKVHLTKPDAAVQCLVRADVSHMTQVIINLLENARDHSPEGTGIECSVDVRMGTMVVFSVKDGGTGIPKEHLPMIFDPFFTTRKGGTGLGLSIVRRIVENHWGSISAWNNVPAPGATFEVVLPRIHQ